MAKKKKEYKSSIEKALENPRIKSQYLKEVERLFKGPKGDLAHEKDLQKLHNSYGTNTFKKHAKSYIKKYGLPDDWGVLILLLDLKGEAEIVIDTMEKLVELSSSMSSQEKKGLKSKLKTLCFTSKEIEVAEVAEALLEEI